MDGAGEAGFGMLLKGHAWWLVIPLAAALGWAIARLYRREAEPLLRAGTWLRALRVTVVVADRRDLTGFEMAFGKVKAELYPDAAGLAEAERRRFGLLLEHTDVPITLDDMSSW